MPTPKYNITAQTIAELTGRAYQKILGDLAGGATARDAIGKALDGFRGEYYEVLAAALTETLRVSVGSDDVRDWPVRGITLSRTLYQDAVAVQAAALKTVEEHTKWQHSARQLALELFEGYGFRPDEVLKTAVGLPKYMRDAFAESEIAALLSRMQASALKTSALKAGYMQALDALLNGAGQQALEKALWVAVQERYRYFANRIAQTELHRAHTKQLAEEYAAWADLEVVEYRLSHTHPEPDICDLFAHQDLYGLGAGRYPKDKAPAPPLHPFCRCLLRPVLGELAGGQAELKNGAADYLRTLDPKVAARIAGSKAKLAAILQGEPALGVFNAGRPDGYQIGTLGDLAKMPFPVDLTPPGPPPPKKSWFDENTESGSWHKKAFAEAPEYLLAAIGKNGDFPIIPPDPVEGAYQNRGRIHMGQRHTDQKGSPKADSVWRHEVGHLLDYNSSDTLGLYATDKMLDTLDLDAKHLLKNAGAGRASKAREEKRRELQGKYDQAARDAERSDAEQHQRKLADGLGLDLDRLDAWVRENSLAYDNAGAALERRGLILTAIKEGDAAGLLHALENADLYPGGTWSPKASERSKAYYRGAVGELSDLFSAATRRKIEGCAGHSDQYYRDRGKPGQLKEVVANITALVGGPYGDQWEVILRRLLPATTGQWLQHLEDWGKG